MRVLLFKEDWKRFPSAIPDYDTKNKSFLDYVSLLQQMGIENCLFPLALYQPQLVGVDPFAENLTAEQMAMIGVEVAVNPWYYLREVCRLPPQAGSDSVPIIANRAIIALFWVVLNNIDIFLQQPRQTGKSVGADCMDSYNIHFRLMNTNLFLLTKDTTLLKNNIERLKKMRKLLPSYLIKTTAKDRDNTDFFNYAARENNLWAKPSPNDEDAAGKTGRGLTTACQHYDELPFIKFIHKIYPVAQSAADAARQEAIRKNAPYYSMITTTAGELNKPEGRFSYGLLSKGAPFTENFYDCQNKDSLLDVIKKNSKSKYAPIVNARFNHRQLGMTDELMYSNISRGLADGNVDTDQIDRDYFLRWTTGGIDSILPEAVSSAIRKSEKEPDYIELTQSGYIIKWYIPENEIKSYMANNVTIVGADTSELVGIDNTSFTIISIEDLSVIARISTNTGNIFILSDWFASLMLDYVNMVLVMERKSSGSAFLDLLLVRLINAGENPFRRIYNVIAQEPITHKKTFQKVANTRFGFASLVDENKKYFGFNQTGSTREKLYGLVLKQATSQARNKIYDRELSTELRDLKIKNGRVDHGAGKHDDAVMSWLLACWFLFHGVNHEFYGIDGRKVLSKVSNTGEILTEEKRVDNQLIDQYQSQLDSFKERLSNTDIIPLMYKYEKEIQLLTEKIRQLGGEVKNTDNIIKEVKHANPKFQRRRAFSLR